MSLPRSLQTFGHASDSSVCQFNTWVLELARLYEMHKFINVDYTWMWANLKYQLLVLNMGCTVSYSSVYQWEFRLGL